MEHLSPGLLGIPLENRYALYSEQLHLSSLGRLCCVSTRFRVEITETIFKPTITANGYCKDIFSNLDSLLLHTQTNGKKIKWLHLNLKEAEKLGTNEAIPAEKIIENTQKIIAILCNCPNLASLFVSYGYGNVDDNQLFDHINNNILPKAQLIESLTFQDTITNGWPYNRVLKNVEEININLLSRLKKFSIKNFDFNEKILEQVKNLSENMDINLHIRCVTTIPEHILKKIKELNPNSKIFWDLTPGNFSFPDDNLKLIQEITCHQEVYIMVTRMPSDEQIFLFQPFKSVTLCLLLPLNELEGRVKTLIPELNLRIQNATYVNGHEFLK